MLPETRGRDLTHVSEDAAAPADHAAHAGRTASRTDNAVSR
jgi:hypothetical protein